MSFLVDEDNVSIDPRDVTWVQESAKNKVVKVEYACSQTGLQGDIAQNLASMAAAGIDVIPAMMDECDTRFFLNPKKFEIVLCGDDFYLQCDESSHKFCPMNDDFSAEIDLDELTRNHLGMWYTFESDEHFSYTF